MSNDPEIVPQIPLPTPSAVTGPFWFGTHENKLLFQRCQDCKGITFIPQAACMHCLSEKLGWEESKGKGTVYSYTTIYRPQTPAFHPPYVVAVIDVDEGYQMMSNLVDCEPEEACVGMPVEVLFYPYSDLVTLPYFRPVRKY